ncbi:VanZ family protein [Sulfuricystis multivorans]|uniref:VanZ family protein n=1 Tax=Sulfuricystis multivorans TaxID=2211108 RepID=UPI000F829A25|nr:VanZ family protein [Sulfuricystis multivorans]
MTARLGKPQVQTSGAVWLGWFAYLVFVVYGSLVPLDYQPLPWDQALARFAQIPMLKLGVENRADWVANGVLYLPVGFLTAALAGAHSGGWRRVSVVVLALAFSFALAIGVEFLQLFFPPRTVSRNDVIAEWLGSVLGIVLALYWSDWFQRFLAALAGRRERLIGYGLPAYVAGYLAFSFFPYDFLLSSTELSARFASDGWGMILAGQSLERGAIVLAAKLAAETLAVVPLGLMLGRWNEAHRYPATRRSWLVGGLLGLFVETAQFFIYSGISQGVSLLTRAAGMYAGALLWRERGRVHTIRETLAGGRLFYLLGIYGLVLVAFNGVFDHAWQGLAAAGESLAGTRFLPFYYHYYTTEQAALLSLASVALMYAPLGGLAWLRGWPSAWGVALAALLALFMESTKLFLVGMHPDPTNVLIAAFAAGATAQGMKRPGHDRPAESFSAAAAVAPGVVSLREVVTLVLVSGLAVWVGIDFPFGSFFLAGALLLYALLLWRAPALMWAAIPIALPLLDLAPWSGRFYLDEFDYLLIVSLIVGFARIRAVPQNHPRDRAAQVMSVILVLAFAIGTLRGLLPWQWPDINGFSNYYSPWNAVRLAKGVLWAVLLSALLRRFSAAGHDAWRWFAEGMVIGLAGVVAVVVWERATFPGLFNFSDVYRVTGPFSAMHVGGADIETFITLATPFAVLMLAEARSGAARLVFGVVVLGATYALMMTFSRAGYAGFALALMMALLLQVRRHGRPDAGLRRWAVPGAVVVGVLAIVGAVLSGSFAQERVASAGKDLDTRIAHWRDALALRDDDWMIRLFGMGLGRFPETHYWRSAESRAGGYRLVREGNAVFLRLGAGHPLYIEQFVAIEPQREYRLHITLRAARQDGRLVVTLCEKWLLTSAQCVSRTVAANDLQWQHHEIPFASESVGLGHGWLRPPVKLSVFNASPTRVDIDDIQLVDAHGRVLLGNADFSRGLDDWFFSVDQDLPWHVWSLPIGLLFDLGWFGLLAFGAAVLFALMRHGSAAWQGDKAAAACLAALSGLLMLAGVDTLVDTPRLLLLILFLLISVRSRSRLGRS